uniref:hypothetical protein n=1 Tax=Parerythrobacter lutipelagi TaxID=1964208 RepID=UPI0010F6A7DD|nr:hypothetical protein [Parerythrobacter lutipelagi]
MALTACGTQPAQPPASADETDLSAGNSSSPAAPEESATVPMTVSLGQALRCSRIGEFAVSRSSALKNLSSDQARSIALKAKNAAYAEGAKQDLTPAQIDDQERKIYLGYEGAAVGAVSAFRRSKEEEDAAFSEADRRTRAAIERVEPELSAELIEICAPLFLG